MNERLKELANKSGFGPAWYDPTIPTSDIDRRWVDQRRLKEFAKLIVQECAKICECEWDGDADTFAASEAYNECAESIKAHFGVEE